MDLCFSELTKIMTHDILEKVRAEHTQRCNIGFLACGGSVGPELDFPQILGMYSPKCVLLSFAVC